MGKSKVSKKIRRRISITILFFVFGFIAISLAGHQNEAIAEKPAVDKTTNIESAIDEREQILWSQTDTIGVSAPLVVKKYFTGGRYVVSFTYDAELMEKDEHARDRSLSNDTLNWINDHKNVVDTSKPPIKSTSEIKVYEAK